MNIHPAAVGFMAWWIIGTSPFLAQDEIPLWADGMPPYARSAENLERIDDNCWGGVPCARHVVTPTLTLFPAREASNTWLLIIPGGGYDSVAIEHEGAEIAQAFSDRGITAAVLKYRVPDRRTATQPERVPLADLRKAMALLREAQQSVGREQGLIGALGFSAGGHLAAFSMVHPDEDQKLNADFGLLIYGVSVFSPKNRDWLESALYYRPLTDSEAEREDLARHVTADTPPAFFVHAQDDEVTPTIETTHYAEALNAAGVEAEVHLFARGGHGFGAGQDSDGTSQWIDLAVNWVNRLAAGSGATPTMNSER